MPKTLLALLLLLAAVPVAFAGPPEGVSGAMVFDEMVDGFLRYPREKGDGRRIEWLKRVAPGRDPRVAIALVELVFDGDDLAMREEAALTLWVHYIHPGGSRDAFLRDPEKLRALRLRVKEWWGDHGDGLLRRAKQLP